RELHFSLLKQHLLELIRQGKLDEALDFGQDQLAPLGAGDPALLREIEEAVCLVAFK
ncbi:unnamed protein product, partial [Discosporangium mesarthrocarpum]